MIFVIFSCSSQTGQKPDLSESDLGSDADTDSDSDADTDSGSGTTGSSFHSGAEDSGSLDCGDPSVPYSSFAVPLSGEVLDTVHSYDLCLGSSAGSGWLSFSAWDGGQLAYQVGWEVSSSSSPSPIPVPAYFETDASWHLEFSGEQLLAGDPVLFGVTFEAGSLTAPLDVAIDEDGGEVYFYSSSWEVWYRLDPYDDLVAVPTGPFWDVDYDADGPEVIVP